MFNINQPSPPPPPSGKVKFGGLIYSVIPHRDALASDAAKELTTISHQLDDFAIDQTSETHSFDPEVDGRFGHYHVYTLESYLKLISYVKETWIWSTMLSFEIIETLERDDKVGNGFVVVHRVLK